MSVDEVLKVAAQYASAYVATFAAILASPSRQDWPIRFRNRPQAKLLFDRSEATRLTPDLFVFLACSVLLGYTIASAIPGRGDKPGVAVTLVVTVSFWVAYSSILHLLCRLLGGDGSYFDTLAVSLQVFAALYVLSTFAVLVLAALVGTDAPFYELGVTASLYFPIHAALLGVYLPVVLTRVHKLAWPKYLLVLVPFAVLLGYVGWSVHREASIDYYPPHAPWWTWWDAS